MKPTSQTQSPNFQNSRQCEHTPALPIAVHEIVLKLGEQAVANGQEIFLKGGVACFYYAQRALGGSSTTLILRPVSLDIDWTCDVSDDTLGKQLQILSAVSGGPVSLTANREEYGALTFGSMIARGGAATSSGAHVELDLIPVCRFIPDSTGFMYEFSADVEKTDSGTPFVEGLQGVRLNSIETILCEKLGLGRGSEMGKFDIVDSALLLSLAPVSPDAVSRIVHAQEFKADLESPLDHAQRAKRVEDAFRHISDAAEIATLIGCGQDSSCLKRLAFIARMLSGLERANSEALATFFTNETPADLISKLYKTLADNTTALRHALVVHARSIAASPKGSLPTETLLK